MSLMDDIRIAQRDAGEAAVIANLARMGLETEQAKIERLTATAHATLRAAEKAWYELFGELPVGADRCHASDVYERIRHATRRGG